MLAGLETITDSVATGNTNCYNRKRINRMLLFFWGTFFIFFEKKIDFWAVYRDLHLHECSSVWKEMPTIRTEYGAYGSTFPESLLGSSLSNAWMHIYFWILHVEDELLCDSHIVSGHLMADDSSICYAENEPLDQGRNWFETLCF